MEIITNILFLSVSVIVFFAYRQGICDSYALKNNLPLKKTKEEEKREDEFTKEYSKMMNYTFDMAGDSDVGN